MRKKIEAWKTINSVLVQANSQFMSGLASMLTEQEVLLSQLEEKLKSGNATEEDNAEYLFKAGYTSCLRDVLSAKKVQEGK